MNKDQLLNRLKPTLGNPQQANALEEYFDYLIIEQHRVMEQTDSITIVHRAQGAITQLRRLKLLKDEVLNGR
jgi:hydrogenase maturation factor HypF (carbamoyltransferase family)